MDDQTGITIEDFQRIQNEVLRLKTENLELEDQLNRINTSIKTNSNSTSTLTSLSITNMFKGNDSAELSRLSDEEKDLQKSLQSALSINNSLKEQCQGISTTISVSDQINSIFSLFQTKKRELIRMKELNDTTLQDLQEEFELVHVLSDSLENGKNALLRDKELAEKNILQLQGSKAAQESRKQELEELISALRVKIGDHTIENEKMADLASQIEQQMNVLAQKKKELQDLQERFQNEEDELKKECNEKQAICNKLQVEQDQSNSEAKAQIKALRKEFQELTSAEKRQEKSPKKTETVQIDYDSLIRENQGLQDRLNSIEKHKANLKQMATKHQMDCEYLGKWMKKEKIARESPEAVINELKQQLATTQNELNQLQSK